MGGFANCMPYDQNNASFLWMHQKQASQLVLLGNYSPALISYGWQKKATNIIKANWSLHWLELCLFRRRIGKTFLKNKKNLPKSLVNFTIFMYYRETWSGSSLSSRRAPSQTCHGRGANLWPPARQAATLPIEQSKQLKAQSISWDSRFKFGPIYGVYSIEYISLLLFDQYKRSK